MKCKKCQSEDFILKKADPHIGIYCKECKSWQKWASQEEKNLYSFYTEDPDLQYTYMKTDKGHWAIRPTTWECIFDDCGNIIEDGLNHLYIAYSKKDAEHITKILNEKKIITN